MRGGGHGQSRGAEVVLGAVRRTEPGHGGHREMVTGVGALEDFRLARLFLVFAIWFQVLTSCVLSTISTLKERRD